MNKIEVIMGDGTPTPPEVQNAVEKKIAEMPSEGRRGCGMRRSLGSLKARISKGEWYRRGGFANPDLFRRMMSGSWSYWVILR